MFLFDMGVPMIVLQFPIMVIALIPIILIETVVIRPKLNISWKETFYGVTLANIGSTLVGIPVAWFIMYVIEILVGLVDSAVFNANSWDSPVLALIGAAWLPPGSRDLYWMIPVASIILLVPSYFCSVLIEYYICRWKWENLPAASIKRSVWLVNLVSYIFLFL